MSGEATKHALRAGEKATFDFTAPAVVVGRRDEAFLLDQFGLRPGDRGDARAVKHVMTVVVQAAFPGGRLKGTDLETWETWLEAIDGDALVVTVTRGMVGWWRARAIKDELELPSGVAQWFGATKRYVEKLWAADPPAGDGA